MKVGIIGAGTMGQGIAKAFAQIDGYEVMLCDIKQEWAEGGKDKIIKGYDKLVAKEKMTKEQADAIVKRIVPGLKENLCKDCDLIVAKNSLLFCKSFAKNTPLRVQNFGHRNAGEDERKQDCYRNGNAALRKIERNVEKCRCRTVKDDLISKISRYHSQFRRYPRKKRTQYLRCLGDSALYQHGDQHHQGLDDKGCGGIDGISCRKIGKG